MARPEEPIPPGERLFRGLRADWSQDGFVSPDAIDLAGMSVNREKFAAPQSVLAEERTGIGWIRPQDFPEPVELNSVTWEFIAVDLPEDANPAHAEIRPRRGGDTSIVARRPNSREARRTLRALLAGRMQVLQLVEGPPGLM